MQQLQAKFKNTPTDTSQVRSSVSSVLNKEETPSAQDKVLDCNNLEGNPLQHAGGQNSTVSAVVCVLGKRGFPLMPTSPRKARKLIENGKAKIVKRFPFTIRMLVSTGGARQEVVLGIDSGHKRIGFSCVSSKKELISGEVELDTKTKERLSEKLMYRRGRRNKLWYREPRFNNREKGSDWIVPSVLRNYNAHLMVIEKIKKLLPVTNTIVEVGNFDIQKIVNPEIQGKEYQQGNLYSFDNVRQFVICREKGKCQLCGKEKGNDVWRFHHIESRMTGSNAPSNIALLHSNCHDKVHEKQLEKSIKKSRSYKEATFMNIVKGRFQKDLGCATTFGYITYNKRKALKLPKTHYNDAFVIANGTSQVRAVTVSIIQKRKNNRTLQTNRKGYAPSIRKQRYSYQPKDLVTVNNKEYEVVGVHSYGKYIKVKNGNEDKLFNFPVKNIQKCFANNSLIWN